MAPNEGRARLDLKPVKGGEVAIPAAAELLAGSACQTRCAGRSVHAGHATRGAASRQAEEPAAKAGREVKAIDLDRTIKLFARAA